MRFPVSVRDFFSRESSKERSWPSVVMLLRQANYLSAEEVSKLADAAYGMTDAQGRISPVIVDASASSVVLQLAPTIFIGFHQVSKRYSSPMLQDQSGSDAVKKMWEEHTAWSSVDAPNRYDLPDKQRRECYKLLFHLVAKLWDGNVCGIHLPAERDNARPVVPPQIPNHGDLIASIRWAGMNLSKDETASSL